MPNFGRAKNTSNPGGVAYRDYKTQSASLQALAEMAQRGSVDPYVRFTALKIIRAAKARDDAAELEALWNALRNGDPDVAPVRDGFKYTADPRFADYFTAPADLLKMGEHGILRGDCDDATGLVCALGGSLGFKMGLRAWGPKGSEFFSHVYPVAAFPKRPPFESEQGLDITVDSASVGWEPPEGNVLTAWLA
jgi:hypothetical protein